MKFQLRLPGKTLLPLLWDQQQKVLDLIGDKSALVLGAPGSGRTTVALSLADQQSEKGRKTVFLCAQTSRVKQLAAQVKTTGASAYTASGLAYEILRSWSVDRTVPLPVPQLVTGAQEDEKIARLLLARWPIPGGLHEDLRAVPALRQEIRNVLARAGEYGLTPDQLEGLGQEQEREEWVQCADIARELEKTLLVKCPDTTRGYRLDSARMQLEATRLLQNWETESKTSKVNVPRPEYDLIVIDDLQDFTAATVNFIAQMQKNGAQIVAFADPDLAVESHRGAGPETIAAFFKKLHLGEERKITLPGPLRGNWQTQSILADQIQRIPSTQNTHRSWIKKNITTENKLTAKNDDNNDNVKVELSSSGPKSRALLIRQLREEHLYNAVTWDQMAVIVRSSADLGALRRDFIANGIPVASRQRALALGSERSVSGILDIFWAALSIVNLTKGAGSQEESAQLCYQIILGPLVGGNTLTLRSLARSLELNRVEDLGIEILTAIIEPKNTIIEAAPEKFVVNNFLFEKTVKLIKIALKTLGKPVPQPVEGEPHIHREEASHPQNESQKYAPSQALWEIWECSEVAEQWQKNAFGTGISALRADDDLDAVMALFRTADVWEERNVGGTINDFLEYLGKSELPVDNLATPGQRPTGVTLTTAPAASGKQWEVVAIYGLNDGTWPNMRTRDSILGGNELGEFIRTGIPNTTGNRIAENKCTLAAERRLLVMALSRSTRQLYLHAVSNEDEAPSAFFTEIARKKHKLEVISGKTQETENNESPFTINPGCEPLDLRSLVAKSRRLAVENITPTGAQNNEENTAQIATDILALLAHSEIGEADPRQWVGVNSVSSTAPLRGEKKDVRLTPSDLETVINCPLKWMLQRHGGSTPASRAQKIGLLIHELAEKYPHGNEDELLQALQELIVELEFADTWEGRLQKRKAEEMVIRLAKYLAKIPGKVEVEVDLGDGKGVPVEDARIVGRIDRIEHVDGGVRVVDIKTGQKVVTAKEAEEHLQLLAYQIALAASGIQVKQAKLVYVSSGTTGPAERIQEADKENKALQYLKQGVKNITDSKFCAIENGTCRSCRLKTSCPLQDEGRRIFQ